MVDHPDLNTVPIGLIYINATPTRDICNTLLLNREWSVSTGNCVLMRTEPGLAYLLYAWRIIYPYENEGIKIKRSIVHPQFNRDTFANNIGLVQHMSVFGFQRYIISKVKLENYFYDDPKDSNMVIINWNHGTLKDTVKKMETHHIQPMTRDNCSTYIASIIELRSYEFCITLKKKINTMLGLGALAEELKDLTVFGIFTWGEREEKFPLVLLNLTHFEEWIESIIAYKSINLQFENSSIKV